MSNPIIRAGGIVLLCTVLLNACSKPDLEADPQPIDKPSGQAMVTISLKGRVTDENATPISGALVRSGNELTTTDINGNYQFTNLRVKPNNGLVEVAANGYFRDYQRFDILPESEQYIQAELVIRESGHQFDAEAGGTYSLASGASLQFSGAAMKDLASGQQYTGTVQVNAFSRQADEPAFYDIIPGAKGTDLSNKPVSIQFLTAVVTELTGTAGQQLQLSTGKAASVKFPIPPSKLAGAPTAISLWYFDPLNGEWKEEGKAVKEGNYYSAQIPHFSTWACGTALPAAPLKATITDVNGAALAFARIQLYSADGKELLGNSVHTNDKGILLMNAPRNSAMEMRVVNACNEILAAQKITTGSSDNWLGTIKAGANAANNLLIQGKVQNCKAAAVYNGWVRVIIDGQIHKAKISNGLFQLSLDRCYNTNTYAKITAVDEDGNMESNTITMEMSTGKVDLGTLSTCNKRNMQYISYTMNGTNYLLQAPVDSLIQTMGTAAKTYTINCYKTADAAAVAFSMSFSGDANPGEYPVTTLKFSQDKTQLTNTGAWLVKITNFGKPGEFIEGNASGRMRDQSSNRTIPFTFQFKVIRNQ
ncbi:carboxypeptidase-like regulatory domain-containing protein [Flavihumibacter sp. CACIAM 22H1]|uniref:carboxypeptidase-like regulatory domain-containing protein n=1 Tax=Flavihumibacter sp. CACIAM 22H1 TaxID=1812911 RepID=UPI000AD19331|nr:carboxypeptidase-like regulatory domain-containing protein [Flavihumibacter sp. CACIAM 22H1]